MTVWEATGPFAYVAAGEAGLLVIDLSRPEAPRELARLATPDAAQDVARVGETVYVAAGAGGLLVVDVATPILPQVRGQVRTPGYAGGVNVVGTQIFVADGPAGVALVDAVDPAAPTLVSSSETPGYATQLTALDRHLYVAPTVTAACASSTPSCRRGRRRPATAPATAQPRLRRCSRTWHWLPSRWRIPHGRPHPQRAAAAAGDHPAHRDRQGVC